MTLTLIISRPDARPRDMSSTSRVKPSQILESYSFQNSHYREQPSITDTMLTKKATSPLDINLDPQPFLYGNFTYHTGVVPCVVTIPHLRHPDASSGLHTE